MNGPVMVIQTVLFIRDYNYRVVYVLTALLQSIARAYLLKLINIYGHFLTVNNRRYGRCDVKNLYRCVLSLNFTLTHLEANSARSFQNAFYKYSRALNIMF